MHVADKNLCERLFELTKWIPERCWYWVTTDQKQVILVDSPFAGGEYPAYDLGFILRKLPERLKTEMLTLARTDYPYSGPKELPTPTIYQWIAGYRDEYGIDILYQHGDTPENAVCQLAIQLHKQGILQKHKDKEVDRG